MVRWFGDRATQPPSIECDILPSVKLTVTVITYNEAQHIGAAIDSAAWTVDPGRLLESVASVPNLAQVLLNVARNKGAAGADGCSVEEVVGAAPRLLLVCSPKVGPVNMVVVATRPEEGTDGQATNTRAN